MEKALTGAVDAPRLEYIVREIEGGGEERETNRTERELIYHHWAQTSES